MTPDMIGGIVRGVLALGGGYLIKQGLTDAESLQTAGGALVTLATIGWSIWTNHATTMAQSLKTQGVIPVNTPVSVK